MIKTISCLLILSSILLASCAATPLQSTVTPAFTDVLLTKAPVGTPAITLTPAPTATSAPTGTPTPDPIAELVPQGTPDKEWNGIPVMTGALAGASDLGSYRFTIKATEAEIQDFYQEQLKAAGWVVLAAGSAQKGTSLLIFTKEDKTLSVQIIAFEDLFIVMFAQ